jgi:hypothetical protein
VANKAAAKYDEWIDDELLAIDYARRALDTDGAWRTAEALLADKQPYETGSVDYRSVIDSQQ